MEGTGNLLSYQLITTLRSFHMGRDQFQSYQKIDEKALCGAELDDKWLKSIVIPHQPNCLALLALAPEYACNSKDNQHCANFTICDYTLDVLGWLDPLTQLLLTT
jgi:hypothetical protein